MQKSIDASGGEAAIAALKDITIAGKVEMMGQAFSFEQKNVFPDGFSTAVKMGEMVLMSQLKKGDAYSTTMQGANQEVDADMKKEMDAKAAFIEERYLLKNSEYKFDLKGIEQVNGKDAYKVVISGPGGGSQSFYDVATGLKVQEIKEQDGGPMGKLSVTSQFLDYKDYSGIKMPSTISIDAGMLKQAISITDVKLNQGLKLADLK